MCDDDDGDDDADTFRDFYLAMLCIAQTMPSKDVRPTVRLSVRLSHAGILSKRLNISSTFFHRRVATPFLVFPHQTVSPSNGGVKCRGAKGKKSRFSATRFVSEMIQDRTIVRPTTECE